MSTAAPHEAAAHDDAGHAHPAHLAHHYDTPEQQFAGAKMGMWVFLGTELLMFGGLFCAYAVYRHNHPEVFKYAHQSLDVTLGGINTCILIASSFTMAWGVRTAQLGKTMATAILLALTFLGGIGFLCIKTVEYHHKYELHTWFGTANNKYAAKYEGADKEKIAPAPIEAPKMAVARRGPEVIDPNAGSADQAKIAPNFQTPVGLSNEQLRIVETHTETHSGTHSGTAAEGEHGSAKHPHISYESLSQRDKDNVYTFYGVYFLMTGLHGLHVVIGMGLIAWVFVRNLKGIFGPAYYTPVDLVGLYWHLVDLIWIFLFPLLYLIH